MHVCCGCRPHVATQGMENSGDPGQALGPRRGPAVAGVEALSVFPSDRIWPHLPPQVIEELVVHARPMLAACCLLAFKALPVHALRLNQPRVPPQAIEGLVVQARPMSAACCCWHLRQSQCMPCD